VKERAAILLADYIHIDASLQSQLSKFNSDPSEIRFRQEGRRGNKPVLPWRLVRISTSRQRKKPVLDWRETLSDLWSKCRIGSIQLG
jgi:hypothetical protein